MITSVATALIDNGKYIRAYLGVGISNVSDDMSSFYDNKFGALVTSVEEDTPAFKANLKRGDLIIAVNNKEIKSASQLKNIIGSFAPDKSVKIKILRDKKVYIKNVKLGSQDKILASLDSQSYKGLSVETLNTKTNIKGVLVSKIDPQSEAAETGIMDGDIIIQIENNEIKNIDDFKKATNNDKKKRIYIYRKGTIFAIVL